jgi:glutaredoxin
MKIELFYTPGCAKCAENKEALKATAAELVPDAVWLDLNVLDELDHAVEVGVLTLPSIAIDGEVIFASLATCRQLRRELADRIGKKA